MFGISKSTVQQLVKEFRIPLVVATAWTTYAVWGPEVSFKSIISTFGTSFFLASWMTGQIFRVRKQAGVEKSFGSVEQRLNHLVNELESKTENMISHITGGDSYLHFFPVSFVGTKILWIAIHKGQYSLQQVNVTITDVEKLSGSFRAQGILDFTAKHKLGDVHCGMNQKIAENDVGDRDRFSFKIVTHARNGTFEQETRFARVNGAMRVATRIKGDSGVVHEEIHPEFPGYAEGKIAWDKPHVGAGDEKPKNVEPAT
ncbi:hypothetical protein CD58_18240 [Pseudomonas brassicacearum]|uniref:hypothetical protein n=1 Tax=Pseudomonas brassicacearum TaxID=930166 RepID=UPI00042EAD2B|nr:hypothetical protein [Pseudomonas brassicacearum]AHL36908.1 hypothetical protein CD58_18240 [Pseudomonas brassicacearum]